MKEQIQLILAQARSQVRQDLEYSPDALLPQELVDEKFAELIVRECAAEAHHRVCTEGNDNMIYVHLLEHFGVEP